MPITLANPPGLYDPSANGYSHLAIVPAGPLLFVAGQGGEDAGGALPPDFRAQVRAAFANLDIAVRAGGATLADVAKLTMLVVDHDEARLAIVGEELARAFGPGAKPANTLIPVARLALDGMLFEVEAIAALGAGSTGNGAAGED